MSTRALATAHCRKQVWIATQPKTMLHVILYYIVLDYALLHYTIPSYTKLLFPATLVCAQAAREPDSAAVPEEAKPQALQTKQEG